MAYMKDRSLKQIATNIVPQGNVPNVPQHLQTGSYYPQGTTNTPPPMGDAFVAGPQGPQIYNNQMGMGAQMGTAPIAQEKKMMRTVKPLEKKPASETYSKYTDFEGIERRATIDDSTFVTDSARYAPGGKLDWNLPNKYQVRAEQSYGYNKEFYPKGVEFLERTTPTED